MSFATIASRWKQQWKERGLTPRVQDLALVTLNRLMITIVLAAGFGAVIFYLLPYVPELAVEGTMFLAVVYTLTLAISTIHSFDQNRMEHMLQQIQLDLSHIYCEKGYAHLDELLQSINSLLDKMGEPL